MPEEAGRSARCFMSADRRDPALAKRLIMPAMMPPSGI